MKSSYIYNKYFKDELKTPENSMISGKQVKEKFMRSASCVAQFNITLQTVSLIQI